MKVNGKMTKINRYPENNNLLQPSKIQLTFTRLPNLTFYCQKVNLPGLKINFAEQKTQFATVPRPGTKLEYDDLDFTFLNDEDLRTWLEIHNWLRGMGLPNKFEEYKNMQNENKDFGGKGIYSDIILNILSNDNNVNWRIHFENCFPVYLTSIPFDVATETQDPLLSQAIFKFVKFEISKQNKN